MCSEHRDKMCGIIGEISYDKIDLKKFIEMRDELRHRGPDDSGLWINKDKKIALGHRRLSIIDLSPSGKQPMSNEDGTIWLTFNGEIYNYIELREELIEMGHKFKSKTDSEVIIHLYEEFGERCVEKLRGMFAFGVWDERIKRLFLARDRFGIKPLYYYKNKGRFIFASEIKAIIKDNNIERKINPTALRYYFIYRYIPAPYSIWKNIYKLPHAHYLTYDYVENIFKVKKYWNLDLKNYREDEGHVVGKIKDLLEESVRYHFVSDVPVGILLSGGLDSSIITAIGSKLNINTRTFSIGFESEKYTELPYARLVSKKFGVKNIEKILTRYKIMSLLDNDILYYYDEPMADTSIFPTFLLMETVSQKLKVALSGDGGDETFAGYNWYRWFYFYKRFTLFSGFFRLLYILVSKLPENCNKFIPLKLLRFYLRPFTIHDNFERYRAIMDPYFDESEIRNLLCGDIYKEIEDENEEDIIRGYVNDLTNVKDMQVLDINSFLVDDILTKVDRASMAHSLEIRVPFLDYPLTEYVMSLDSELIFKNNEKKYILKKVASLLGLPNEIIYRKKKGFSAPVDELGIINKYSKILKNSYAAKDGILNQNFINKLLLSKDRKENYRKIWLLIIFELWYRRWMH